MNYSATTEWFGNYLDLMVAIYLAFCVSIFLLMPSNFLGGDVGVAISSCLSLVGLLQHSIRQSAEAENLMISVERVMEYGNIKSEDYLPANNNTCDKSMDIKYCRYLSLFQ